MATEESAKAVRSAFDYLLKVSPAPSKFSNFRLEEIQIDKEGYFHITLSYDVTGEFGFDRQREFKDFKVKKDGTVDSMKIRKV